MPAQTYSANAVAIEVRKRTSRPCDGRRVRSWARANIVRLDDSHRDGYTTHAYTAAEKARIVDALVKRSAARATGTDGRASSASRGRSGTAKVTRTAPKAPKVQPATVKPAPGIVDGTDA